DLPAAQLGVRHELGRRAGRRRGRGPHLARPRRTGPRPDQRRTRLPLERRLRSCIMSYVNPADFAKKMIDAGEAKVFMSTKDTLIRAYMAGAILALAAAFAVTVTVNTGEPLLGALLFPVGFCMLYLLGFDLLTGVFTLVPLALIAKRPGVTVGGVLRNWGLVFIGNFA